MTDTTDTPNVSKRGWVLGAAGVVIALAGGVMLGLLVAGAFPQWGRETTPMQDLNPDTVRPIAQAPQTDTAGDPGPDDGRIITAPVTEPDPGPDPVAEEALRSLLARRSEEETRLAERRRLASESPLTPSLTDLADLAQPGNRETAPVPGTATETAGHPGSATDGALTDTPAITHVLARGAIIPAVLESAIDSDLPGLVRARVSEDVYDSLTGAHVLIPRGAALVGTYAQASRAGQRRLFVTWTDLRLPDGTPLDMGDFSSLGADGAAGLRGRRSTGFLKALGAAVLFDLAGNATQILTGQDQTEEGDLASLVAAATGNATSRVADQYLGQILSGGTRFRVGAGAIMNVIVEDDMTLPAQGWQP